MLTVYIRVLVALCVSLVFLNGLYFGFSFVNNTPPNLISCTIYGVFLHYILLVSLCWMMCLGVIQYFVYVSVFSIVRRFFLISTIFSLGECQWSVVRLFSCAAKYKQNQINNFSQFSIGLPLVPISIMLTVNWRLYSSRNDK